MAGTYLDKVGGVTTQQSAINTSAGAGDAGKIAKLDSTGRWDDSMMPVGIGPEIATVTTTEDLAAGDFVNIYASTGAKCRKADATTAGKEANGFVLASTTSGQDATVYFSSNTNTSLSGMTPGSKYYLSTTAGQATTTAPSASGNVVQYLGKASSATELNFVEGDPCTLA